MAVDLVAMVVGIEAEAMRAETVAIREVKPADQSVVVVMEGVLLVDTVEADKVALPVMVAVAMAAACKAGMHQLLCICHLSTGNNTELCRRSIACTRRYTSLRCAVASNTVAATPPGC